MQTYLFLKRRLLWPFNFGFNSSEQMQIYTSAFRRQRWSGSVHESSEQQSIRS